MKNEETNSSENNMTAAHPKGLGPIWILAGMGFIFVAIIVFEVFFKAKL